MGNTIVGVSPEGYPDMKAECTIIVTADKDALNQVLKEAKEIASEYSIHRKAIRTCRQ